MGLPPPAITPRTPTKPRCAPAGNQTYSSGLQVRGLISADEPEALAEDSVQMHREGLPNAPALNAGLAVGRTSVPYSLSPDPSQASVPVSREGPVRRFRGGRQPRGCQGAVAQGLVGRLRVGQTVPASSTFLSFFTRPRPVQMLLHLQKKDGRRMDGLGAPTDGVHCSRRSLESGSQALQSRAEDVCSSSVAREGPSWGTARAQWGTVRVHTFCGGRMVFVGDGGCGLEGGILQEWGHGGGGIRIDRGTGV